ncbi:MAG: nucleoside phosphorylase [Eubacteriales bacterium]|nr:nucleoside phosphorylase [Eubacteriales bacterium]
MSYPIAEFDNEHSLISPSLSDELITDPNGIDTCVMTYYPDIENVEDIAKDLTPLYCFHSGAAEIMQYIYKDSIIIANMPSGAPSSASIMEELISLGVRRFVCMGGSGLIDGKFNVDSYLLVSDAIRDEGTSYHYLPAGERAYTSPLLSGQLAACFKKRNAEFKVGRVWSTDAIYRETPARIKRRLSEGAIGVDMECAALCAVAQRRGVEYAQALYFTDCLYQDVWSGIVPHYKELRLKALRLIIDCGLEIADMI